MSDHINGKEAQPNPPPLLHFEIRRVAFILFAAYTRLQTMNARNQTGLPIGAYAGSLQHDCSARSKATPGPMREPLHVAEECTDEQGNHNHTAITASRKQPDPNNTKPTHFTKHAN